MTNTRMALQTRLLGVVTASEVDWENAKFEAPDLETPYYKSDLVQGRSDNLAMDTMDAQGGGIYQVTLNYPVNQGTVSIENEAQTIMDYFVGQTLVYNDAKVTILTQPYYTELDSTADRYIGSVSIPYTTIKI